MSKGASSHIYTLSSDGVTFKTKMCNCTNTAHRNTSEHIQWFILSGICLQVHVLCALFMKPETCDIHCRKIFLEIFSDSISILENQFHCQEILVKLTFRGNQELLHKPTYLCFAVRLQKHALCLRFKYNIICNVLQTRDVCV